MPRLIASIIFSSALLACAHAPMPAQAQGKAAARDAYCSKKKVASEREICRDKDLTRRDGVLNDVYRELRGKLGRSDFKGLRKEQRAWLRERNGCGADTSCLADMYMDRVAVLEQMLENLAYPNKSHVEIGCDGPGQRYVNGECLQETGAVWHTMAFNDETNKGRYTAYLRFGVPETDDVTFEAVCQAGSSGRFATTVAGYNTGKLREGTNVVFNVSIEEHRQTFDGEVYGTVQFEEGVSGVLLRPGLDNSLWEALAHGEALEYAVEGMNTVRLPLRNSGKAVRKFVDACQAMVTAGGGSSGGRDEIPLSEKNRTCDAWGKIASKKSDTAVTVTFVNKTDSHRAVMWINFVGTPVDYAALNPGESYKVKTYVGHPWMFTDGPGNCIEMFMPKAGVSVFEITADSPFFGPETD